MRKVYDLDYSLRSGLVEPLPPPPSFPPAAPAGSAVLVIGRVLWVELDAAVVRGGLGSSGRKVKALAGLDRHPHSLRNRLARLAAREE